MLWLCLGVLFFCSSIEWGSKNAWMAWMLVVGGIYSLQPFPSCWLTLLSMGTLDSSVVHRTHYCSLSGECHVRQPLEFGAVDRWSPLFSCGTWQSSATWRCILSSDFCRSDCYTFNRSRSWLLLRCLTWQSGGAPDSPMNFSGRALRKPESGQFAEGCILGTGQCPVHHWLHQILYAPNFVVFPQVFSLYVYVELYAPEKNIH
jgi:hypothetical protein